jgi:hypothetical protein
MTPVDLDSLPKDGLRECHFDLLERFCALEEQMMALKDELARLKGGSGRPPIKPSGKERSSEGRQAKAEGRTGKSGRGPRNHRLDITEERPCANASSSFSSAAPGSPRSAGC